MFDVGFSELILIGLVVLVVFGPNQLPKLVREISFWIRKMQSFAASAQSEVERELQVVELRESLRQKKETFEQGLNALPIKHPTQWLPRPPGLNNIPQKDTDQA